VEARGWTELARAENDARSGLQKREVERRVIGELVGFSDLEGCSSEVDRGYGTADGGE